MVAKDFQGKCFRCYKHPYLVPLKPPTFHASHNLESTPTDSQLPTILKLKVDVSGTEKRVYIYHG